MKQFFCLFAFVFCTFTCLSSLQAQKPLRISNGCNYYGKETEQDYYQFEPTNEARQIVNELLQSSGLSASSFQLKESNCSNALATTVNGLRFILYNPDFLRKFKQDAATKWAAYGVLAHEIGHHLNGHNLAETDPSLRRQYELEADKFAGNLLFHLHATIEEAQAGIRTIPLEGESNTHPAKSARLVATTNGWTTAYDLSRKNGDVIPTPAKTAAMPTFTEVSDRLIARKLLGSWKIKSSIIHNDGQASTETNLEFDIEGKGIELQLGGTVIARKLPFTWEMKGGYLIMYKEDLIEKKYSLKFVDKNETMLEMIPFNINEQAIQFKRVVKNQFEGIPVFRN